MLIVEKVEGNVVVVEDADKQFNIDISLVDGKIKDGDILIKALNGRYHKDDEATEKRRSEIIALQNSLWN